jgi:PhnB protein
MSQAKHYLPEGLRTVTPHLVVRNGLEAIAFYKNAFAAELRNHAPGPTPGSTMHAELRIGDSAVFVMDSPTPSSTIGTTTLIHLFVPNADTAFKQAVAAGATVAMPLMDMFWGDRYGQVADPFGHVWALATHKEDVSPDEIERRAQAFYAQMPKP